MSAALVLSSYSPIENLAAGDAGAKLASVGGGVTSSDRLHDDGRGCYAAEANDRWIHYQPFR